MCVYIYTRMLTENTIIISNKQIEIEERNQNFDLHLWLCSISGAVSLKLPQNQADSSAMATFVFFVIATKSFNRRRRRS